MTTNNIKHTILNRTTAISQQFVLSSGFIDVVFGVSTISSHVTTRLSTRLFLNVLQSFRYSPMSQSLSHLQAHMLGFQGQCSSHIQCSIVFLHSHWHFSLSHFCFELHFLPSNSHLHSHKICFINVLIHVFLLSYFQIYIFYFIGHTYSTKRFFNSIITSITPVQTNHKQIVMKFIRIQINKHWSGHALLIIYRYMFCGHDLPDSESTSTRTNMCLLMNPGIHSILCFFIKYEYLQYCWYQQSQN